jgi:hypothetical protein
MIQIESPIPIQITKPKLLIGEGKEEQDFFSALLVHLGVSDIQVEQYGGKSNLPAYLKALKLRPGFARLLSVGVTRDADLDPTAATQSVEAAIQNAAFETNVSVRRFVLPVVSAPGALEDLCLDSIKGSALSNCVEEFFECAIRAGACSSHTASDKSKARIHAWLATQNPPDLRLGIAAKQNLIDWNSPSFQQLKEFLLTL